MFPMKMSERALATKVCIEQIDKEILEKCQMS